MAKDIGKVSAPPEVIMAISEQKLSVCLDSSRSLFRHVRSNWCAVFTAAEEQTLNSSHPGQNGRHLPDNIFECIFMNEKSCFFCFKVRWRLFLKFQLTISQHGSGNGLAPYRRQAII